MEQQLKNNFPVNSAMSLTDVEDGSVHDHLLRGIGLKESNIITLDADNTTASVNIFQITGTVQIFRLYAEIVDATTLTDCDSASFDFCADGAAVQLSAATGDIGGTPVGTYIIKGGLSSDVFTVNDATDVAISEQTYEGSDGFSPCILTQKVSTDSYIRFTYTTTDAPINAQLKVYIEYRPLDGGTLVVV